MKTGTGRSLDYLVLHMAGREDLASSPWDRGVIASREDETAEDSGS